MSVAGGACAWLADWLGYKIGKKKLSIWHIRPRHVARITVVVAGMLIPVLTILIFYAVSSEFRMWLSKGSEAVAELKQKTLELDQKSKEIVEKERQLAARKNDLRMLQN